MSRSATEPHWPTSISNGKTRPSSAGHGSTMPPPKELRQVFYGPDAPPNVAMLPYGDLSLLPDRPSQAKLQELRKALEKWRTSGPGAPPRALVLGGFEGAV